MLSRHNDGCGPLTLQEGRCTIYGVTGGLTGKVEGGRSVGSQRA